MKSSDERAPGGSVQLLIAGKSLAACKALAYAADVLRLGYSRWHLAAIPSASDPPDHDWQPSLRATARRAAIPVIASVQAAQPTANDVLISLQYDRRIEPYELNGARAYNIHFAPLPAYRGSATGPQLLRQGGRTSAVTLHLLTPDLDAGPIVAKRRFPVPEFMSSFDLYHAHCLHAYELFKEHLESLLDGADSSTPQRSRGRTFRRNDFPYDQKDMTDFGLPAAVVRDLARSLIFPPYQLPTFRGKDVIGAEVISLARSRTRVDEIGGTPIVDDRHAVVRCADGYVRLTFAE